METLAIASALLFTVILTATAVAYIDRMLYKDTVDHLTRSLKDARNAQRAAVTEIRNRGVIIDDQTRVIAVLRREVSANRFASLAQVATQARAGVDEATVASVMDRFDDQAAEFFRRPKGD